jgi:serine phosphatase RsbU (regulator of sigma subunit)
MFGIERLKQVIAGQLAQPSSSVIEAVFRELALFTESETFDDDVSIVVMKFNNL